MCVVNKADRVRLHGIQKGELSVFLGRWGCLLLLGVQDRPEVVMGDDSRDAVWANSLQRHQCDILLEGLCELDDARHVLAVIGGEVVGAQTAIEGTKPLRGRNGLGPVCVAAYLSSCREELTSNAFAKEAAPCRPILLLRRLGAEKGTSRQRVVTVLVPCVWWHT